MANGRKPSPDRLTGKMLVMPIPVRCQCGAAFAAKDELAGRTLKCPKCQQPLTIPSPATQAASASEAATQQPMAIGGAVSSKMASLLDDVGMANTSRGERECPSCRKPMPQAAVLCVNCGFHLAVGKKVAGAAVKSHGDGHGDNATLYLERAAASVAEEKEDVKKQTGEGMPWYAWLGLLMLTVGFITLMLLIPQNQALFWGGLSVMMIGVGIMIYATVMLFIVASRDSVLQLMLCICTFPVYLYFVFPFLRWDRCGPFFSMLIVGVGVISTGFFMGFILPPFMVGDEDNQINRLRNEPHRIQLVASMESDRPPAVLRGAGA